MTATDELRRILDERGIEYETDDAQVSETEWYYVTNLRDGYRDRWIYEEPPDCDLLVSYQYDLGAEEAIAATIGDTDATPTRQDDVDLAADNAKLRELVKRMHRHIRQTCGECDGWYCSNFDEDNECCVYDTLARELGVEP